MKNKFKRISAILPVLTVTVILLFGFISTIAAVIAEQLRSTSSENGHIALISGSNLNRIAIIGRDGETVWELPQTDIGWTEVNDADMLSNGNIVFAVRASSGSTVYMVRPDYPNQTGYEILWTYAVPSGGENHTCQVLPDGGILLGEAYTNYVRIVELDASGNVRKTIGSSESSLTDLPLSSNTHNQIRQIHKTAQGTYLVSSMNSAKTIEYSANGEKLAEYPAGGFTAVEDGNGNVIVSGGDALTLTCFSAEGAQLWQVGQSDLPDVTLAFLCSVQVLDNGNIVLANWGGHGGAAGAAVMEITPPTGGASVETVWSLNSGTNTSNVQILDHINETVFKGITDTPYVPEEASVAYRSPVDVAASSVTGLIYAADQTNQTVEVIRATTGVLIDEIKVSQAPNALLLSSDGKYLYVAAGGVQGTVEVFDTAANQRIGEVFVGHTPDALALSEDGNTLYVANRFDDSVQSISLTDGGISESTSAGAAVSVTRQPVGMVLTGGKLYIGGHLPTGNMGDDTVSCEVSVVDAQTLETVKTLTFAPGSSVLRDVAVSPDGEYVYVTHQVNRYTVPTTQGDRGWMCTNAISEIRTSDDTVTATMLVDDLDHGAANPWGIDINASCIVLTASGTRELLILDRTGLRAKVDGILNGTDVKSGYLETAEDIALDLSFTTEFKTRVDLNEDGPRGVALLGDKVCTANYFAGSVSIYDMVKNTMKTVVLDTEKEEDDVRAGERLFHDATVCFQTQQSCASCHPDARNDSLNWDLGGDGFGTPMQTRTQISAWTRGRVNATGITAHARNVVHDSFAGDLFNGAFQSEEMAKVDAYVASLQPGESPALQYGKLLSSSASRGRVLFEGKANCAVCHQAPLYGKDTLVYENYTQDETMEGVGLLVPPLQEVWRTAPYLHDGSAATIMDVLTVRNVSGTHGNAVNLTEAELVDLCNYVLSIGTEYVDVPDKFPVVIDREEGDDIVSGSDIKSLEIAGVQIRTINEPGIRYVARVSTSLLDELKEIFGEDNISYGILLQRTDRIGSGELTDVNINGKTIAAGGAVAVTGLKTFRTYGSYTYYTAVITGIPEAYYDLKITARAYVKVNDSYFFASEPDGVTYASGAQSVGGGYSISLKQAARYIIDNQLSTYQAVESKYGEYLTNHP